MEGKLYLRAEKSYPLRTTLGLLGFRNYPNVHRGDLYLFIRFIEGICIYEEYQDYR